MSAELGRINEDQILRFLRFSVTESAAATYTEQAIATNLSLERGVIWQIHFIEVEMLPNLFDQPTASDVEWAMCQITRESKSAEVNYHDSDIIEKFTRQIVRGAAIGTDAGPMTWGWENPMVREYFPGILYASPNIYVAVDSTRATAMVVRGRIGYTLAKADEKLFFRVAQALIG